MARTFPHRLSKGIELSATLAIIDLQPSDPELERAVPWWWSERLPGLLGLEPAAGEAAFEGFQMAIHPDDRGLLHLMSESALIADHAAATRFRVRGEHGEYRWIEFEIARTPDRRAADGRTQGRRVAIVRDVTGIAEVDTALRRQTREMAELRQSLAIAERLGRIGTVSVDLASGRTLWSEQTYALLGYEAGAIAPSLDALIAAVHSEDRPRVQAVGLLSREGIDLDPIEYRVVDPDGKMRWVRRTARVLSDCRGTPRSVVMTLQDITERKRVEEDLRQSKEHLANAQHISGIGSVEFDRVTGDLRWSDELYRLLGLAPGDVSAGFGVMLSHVHPDDRAAILAAHRRSRAGEAVLPFEFRVTRPDGEVRWLRRQASAFEPSPGTGSRQVITFLDITERKASEERLRLMAEIFESTGEAIAVSDPDFQLIAVNPAFIRLTGFDVGDVAGQMCFEDLQLVAGPAEPCKAMVATLAQEGFWQGEQITRRKDGTVFAAWLTITAIRDESGRTTHRVATFSDISERKTAEDKIHRLAYHDTLTGLANRLNLQGRLEQALTTARREHARVALMFIDMDRFKVINDTLGHAVGDGLLKEVAARLAASVRESDVVARLGGDEFVVGLTSLNSDDAAARQAEKVLTSLGEPYLVEGNLLHSTPSIGIALFPQDGSSVDELMRNADAAMYQAKADGRNRFQFFTPSMNAAAAERLMLEQNMRQALTRGEFLLHYQPQVDATTGRTVGFEALVRWLHPVRGMISPARFIPVAEETGLIKELGAWVLREAARELRRWRNVGKADLRVAVNLSAPQLRSADFPAMMADILAETRLHPSDIELEITESAAMERPQEMIKVLTELRAMGVELAIDDFGTGYSSLNYLKLLPIQRLKLDQSFVRDIESDPNDAAICTATIALAHSLGLEVIAEGVETRAQLSHLRRLGSDIVQGYLFSKPVPPDEARAFIDVRHSLVAA